jgi:hypothetical protein
MEPCPTARALIEGWRPIPSHPGYEAHFDGRIRNAKTGRVLVPQPCRVRNGVARYFKVCLGRAAQVGVHNLVCEAWHGAKPTDRPQVTDHIDNDGSRNAATNLRWASYGMNLRQWYAWQCRLQRDGEDRGEHLHEALTADEHAALARSLAAPGW